MSETFDLSAHYVSGLAQFDPSRPDEILAELKDRYTKKKCSGTARLIDLLSGEERLEIWRQITRSHQKLMRHLKSVDLVNDAVREYHEEQGRRIVEGRSKGGPKDRFYPKVFEAVVHLLNQTPEATTTELWASFDDDGWPGGASPYLGDDGRLHVTGGEEERGLARRSFDRYVTRAREMLRSM